MKIERSQLFESNKYMKRNKLFYLMNIQKQILQSHSNVLLFNLSHIE